MTDGTLSTKLDNSTVHSTLMPIRPIITEPLNSTVRDKVLRGKAKRVGVIDASTRRLIDDLIDTMRDAPGVGLAAPQVGVPLRVIVVEYEDELYTVVNPEIVKSSGQVEDEEGCLSAPNWQGPVTRATSVLVKGRDRSGKEVRIKAEGWLARIFQHEVDHLDGVLFLDKVHDRSKIHWVEADEDEGDGEGAEKRAKRRPAKVREPEGAEL
jgi:peptide deformylase